MSASVDLRDIQRRPAKYWNADGLPELFMGIVWIVWGASWLFGQSLPRGTAWNVFWMFTPALLTFSGMAAVWATRKLKARVTFPRSGYVAWHEPTRLQRLTTAVVAIVAASVIAALSVTSRVHGAERVAPLVLGVVLSLAFVVASLTQHAPHMLALAGVALMLGLAFVGLELGWQSTNWMLIGLGVATAASGAVRFGLFLKRHPLERHA
jgi:hypothetical protein